MKKFIFACLLACFAKPALAVTDIEEFASTATVTTIPVTTGTVIEVDNWAQGNIQSSTSSVIPSTGTIPGRYKVELQNQTGAARVPSGGGKVCDIFCGFDNNVTTTPFNANGANSGAFSGWRIYGSTATADLNIKSFPAAANLKIWCQAEDICGAGGAETTIIQWGRGKP